MKQNAHDATLKRHLVGCTFFQLASDNSAAVARFLALWTPQR